MICKWMRVFVSFFTYLFSSFLLLLMNSNEYDKRESWVWDLSSSTKRFDTKEKNHRKKRFREESPHIIFKWWFADRLLVVLTNLHIQNLSEDSLSLFPLILQPPRRERKRKKNVSLNKSIHTWSSCWRIFVRTSGSAFLALAILSLCVLKCTGLLEACGVFVLLGSSSF